MKELDHWRGDLGNTYTLANSDLSFFEKRVPFWQAVLSQIEVVSIMEVGCNIGGNLHIIHSLAPDVELFGTEPNEMALNMAIKNVPSANISEGTTYDIDGTYDLVFASGVLMHVGEAGIVQSMRNLYLATRKYLLDIEWRVDLVGIPIVLDMDYRDTKEVMWVRPYGNLWKSYHPDLTLIGTGFLGIENGFDKLHWWMFRK